MHGITGVNGERQLKQQCEGDTSRVWGMPEKLDVRDRGIWISCKVYFFLYLSSLYSIPSLAFLPYFFPLRTPGMSEVGPKGWMTQGVEAVARYSLFYTYSSLCTCSHILPYPSPPFPILPYPSLLLPIPLLPKRLNVRGSRIGTSSKAFTFSISFPSSASLCPLSLYTLLYTFSPHLSLSPPSIPPWIYSLLQYQLFQTTYAIHFENNYNNNNNKRQKK